MPDGTTLLVPVLLLVLAAEFVNGWTDAPNAIATVVSTRVFSPLQAVFMAATLNIVGALVTGTAVAATIGKGIVSPEVIDLHVVAAAAITIVLWSSVTAYYGIPTSESHELIAGLTGAGLAAAGPSALLWEGWQKVLIGLGFSTFLGFSISMLVMTVIYWIFRRTSPSSVRKIFSRLQMISAAFMAFSHGSNDGQKFMGVFALALVLGGGDVPVLCSLVGSATLRCGYGPWYSHRRLAHNAYHGLQADQAGAGERLCRREFELNCYSAGFCFWHPSEHYAYHNLVYHRSWSQQAVLSGALGDGR